MKISVERAVERRAVLLQLHAAQPAEGNESFRHFNVINKHIRSRRPHIDEVRIGGNKGAPFRKPHGIQHGIAIHEHIEQSAVAARDLHAFPAVGRGPPAVEGIAVPYGHGKHILRAVCEQKGHRGVGIVRCMLIVERHRDIVVFLRKRVEDPSHFRSVDGTRDIEDALPVVAAGDIIFSVVSQRIDHAVGICLFGRGRRRSSARPARRVDAGKDDDRRSRHRSVHDEQDAPRPVRAKNAHENGKQQHDAGAHRHDQRGNAVRRGGKPDSGHFPFRRVIFDKIQDQPAGDERTRR